MSAKAKRAERKRVKRLYRWLTWQPDLEVAVGSLITRDLRQLHLHLQRKGIDLGIPALIDSLIRDEACRRLMIQTDATDQ